MKNWMRQIRVINKIILLVGLTGLLSIACGEGRVGSIGDNCESKFLDHDQDMDGYIGRIWGGNDCDDFDPRVNPKMDEITYNGKDDDCDANSKDDDLDQDGYTKMGGGDCDDNDATIHPRAKDVPYDSIDQDCSGSDLTDVDRDGYSSNMVTGGMDCNDNDPTVKPGAFDICDDGIDQDCSGNDRSCAFIDRDKDGYSIDQGDCNDENPLVNPGQTEIPYNGLDDDCDSNTPDDDLDGDGYAKVDGGDCNDADAKIHPGAEDFPYDGIDQDCSGIDQTDLDLDGYQALVVGGRDCDDLRPDINPAASEIPDDGVDQDCDGIDDFGQYIELGGPSIDDFWPENDLAFGNHSYLVVSIFWRYVTVVSLDTNGNTVGFVQFDAEEHWFYLSGGPRVAFDGSNFLIVWSVTDGENSAIYAQRLSEDLSFLGASFIIETTTSHIHSLDLAFANGEYLVVWHDDRTWMHGQIVGRRIGTDGEILGDTAIGTPLGATQPISLASDGVDFLVVWAEREIEPFWNVFGQVVSSGGNLEGDSILIASDLKDPGRPAIAFGGFNYLVVFSHLESNWDIAGQFVSPGGSLLYPSSSENLVISDAMNHQYDPSLVFTNGSFLVTWADSRWIGRPSIYSQKVNPDGQLLETASKQNKLVWASWWWESEHYTCLPSLCASRDNVLVVFWSWQVMVEARVALRGKIINR